MKANEIRKIKAKLFMNNIKLFFINICLSLMTIIGKTEFRHYIRKMPRDGTTIKAYMRWREQYKRLK